MPLIHSGSKKAVGKNIKKELQAGKPLKQAQAIALNTQREYKAEGGEAGEMDEVLQSVADELLKAIETKDKSLLLDALEVLVRHIQEADEQEDDAKYELKKEE